MDKKYYQKIYYLYQNIVWILQNIEDIIVISSENEIKQEGIMRVWKKMIGFALSGALAITAAPTGDITAKAAAAMSNVDETVRILPKDASYSMM